MKTYTADELAVIIEKHGKWLRNEDGGERADLAQADLTRADLTWADLTRADLTRANLTGADLTRADLTGANLTGADLSRVNLSRVNLTGATGFIYIGQRSDGHQFFAIYRHEKWLVQAGCRLFSFSEYREHTKTYGCDKKRAETLLILDFAEAMVALRGIV
jgi:uncharacterized protein YjbI with pentapeptide repeats